MKTTIINLLGGPGCGKSTTPAGVFSELKLRSKSAELSREYIKAWAWRKWLPGEYDDLYISGKQVQSEAFLYGKVEYIVTDCPVYIAAFYEDFYYPDRELIKDSLFKFLEFTKTKNVERRNFWLPRRKPFIQEGRYGDEEQALLVDQQMQDWLVKHKIPFEDAGGDDRKRIQNITDLSIAYHEQM